MRAVTWTEVVVLWLAVVASYVVHSLFVIRGFGEPDAARLAVQAAAWHNTGVPIEAYTLRVSPLYLHGLKRLLDLGVPLSSLPSIINWTSVVSGSLCLVPLYFLWRGLAGVTVAVLACALYWATPSFWFGNIYGMPHVPSFALFLTALLAFSGSLGRKGKDGQLLLGTSLLCLTVAVALKADIILCCGAFFGLAFAKRRLDIPTAVLAVAMPVVSLLLVMVEARFILPETETTRQFAANWSERFPFTTDALRDPFNRGVTVAAVGPVLFYAVVASVSYCLVFRRATRWLVMALLWALPAMVLWGLKLGNSARHLMASYSVLMFVVALVIYPARERMPPRWFVWVQLALLLGLNYVSTPAAYTTIAPSTRVLQSSRMLQRDYVDRFHYSGAQFADAPGTKKMYIGRGSRPYVQWEVFARATDFEFTPHRKLTDPWDTIAHRSEGRLDTVRTVYILDTPFTVSRREWPLISTTEQALRRYVKAVE